MANEQTTNVPPPNEFVKTMARHFVSICYQDSTPGERANENAGHGKVQPLSAFVVSVRGNWFLITAGHVLEDIETAMKKGQVLRNFQLCDAWANEAATQRAIPFTFDDAPKDYFMEEGGADIGIITLHPHYRRLLESNGIRAFGEGNWQDAPASCEMYFMLGLPSMLASVKSTSPDLTASQKLVMLSLDKIKKPDNSKSSDEMFFGKLTQKMYSQDGSLTDIDGMSGGPIIGVQSDGSYWAVAVQSRWCEESKTIVGSPIHAALDSLEKQIVALLS